MYVHIYYVHIYMYVYTTMYINIRANKKCSKYKILKTDIKFNRPNC